MTRKYSFVIEGDPTGYSTYVPERSSYLWAVPSALTAISEVFPSLPT
jgi:hypothetical protein